MPNFPTQRSPVAEATFSKAGDPRYFWTEYIKSHSEDITLTWFDIGEPLLIHSQPNQIPNRPGTNSAGTAGRRHDRFRASRLVTRRSNGPQVLTLRER